MYKKLISSAVTLGLLFSCSFAATTLPKPDASGVINITLQDTINYASENNQSIKDRIKDADDGYDTYQKEEAKSNSIMNIPNKSNFSSTDEYAYFKGYKLTNAKNAYNILLKAKDQTIKSTAYNVTKLAYGIATTQKDIDYMTKNKEKMDKDLKIAQLRLKLNMITQNQFNQIKAGISQVNTKYKSLLDAQKANKNTLKTLMNVDRNLTFNVILPKKEFKALDETDLAKLEEMAKTNRLDVIKLQQPYDLAKGDYEVYNHFMGTVGYDEYKKKVDAFEKVKNTYEGSLTDILQKVESAYDDVITSQNEYFDALDAYTNTKASDEVNKKKFSLGMISAIDLLSSQLNFMKAENDLQKALNKNILANTKFIESYNVGDIETPAVVIPSGIPTGMQN